MADPWDEEYAKWRAERDRINAKERERYANDPEYRERVRAYHRKYRAAHREELNAYARDHMRRIRLLRASTTPSPAPDPSSARADR